MWGKTLVIMWLMGVVISRLASLPMRAATISLSEIPVGKVVSVNGLKFVKIADNKYMAVAPWGFMQSWHGCDSLATPTYTPGVKSTYFTQGPVLTDARDGKSYEIRKFPDGKCWMVDNLRYGGTATTGGAIDACSGKTTFAGSGQSIPYAAWYEGSEQLYGDCRDPAAGAPYADNPSNNDANNLCLGNTRCGYFYNWQATMQLPSAYYDTDVTYPVGAPSTTGNYIQGICPDGWHVPSDGATVMTSEFRQLHYAIGGEDNYSSGTPHVDFYKPSSLYTVTAADPWKGGYFGVVNNLGELSSQARSGYWWSSTESGDKLAYSVYTIIVAGIADQTTMQVSNNKFTGFAIRCVKD
jgi:uncharacterized protein (TIGR02145 family)